LTKKPVTGRLGHKAERNMGCGMREIFENISLGCIRNDFSYYHKTHFKATKAER